MSIGEIVAVDLPTIIVLIVLWLIDYFRIGKVEKAVNEIKTKVMGSR